MQYQISGKQIDIGNALQVQVQEQIDTVIEKYSARPTDANVVFSRDAHQFVCEATVHLSTGLTVQARGVAGEIYAALDAATDKMDTQLRRYKRRLKDHHKERVDPIELIGASSYILSPRDETEIKADEPTSPMIVAEMETQVPTISVSEAVMQMELADAKLQVFRNEKHGGVNVVYRREDGNIGWIDPRNLG